MLEHVHMLSMFGLFDAILPVSVKIARGSPCCFAFYELLTVGLVILGCWMLLVPDLFCYICDPDWDVTRHPASSIFPTSNKVKLRFHGCIESRCSTSFLKAMESQICHLHLKQIPCSKLEFSSAPTMWPMWPNCINLQRTLLQIFQHFSWRHIWNSCQQQKELFHVGLPAERPNLVSTLNFLVIIWTDLLILSHDICPESTAENGSTL